MIILHFSCNSNNYYIFVTARNNRKNMRGVKRKRDEDPTFVPGMDLTVPKSYQTEVILFAGENSKLA